VDSIRDGARGSQLPGIRLPLQGFGSEVRDRFVANAYATLGKDRFDDIVQTWIERNGGCYWDQVDRMIAMSTAWLNDYNGGQP
jgi:hypothetical protein